MGDATWEPLLRWHDRTLRAEFERWKGEEIKHGGDGFFVAFREPDDGIACAAAIQRALARHRAEHGFAPSVRIGLHAGEATARDRRLLRIGGHARRSHLRGRRCRRGAGECGAARGLRADGACLW